MTILRNGIHGPLFAGKESLGKRRETHHRRIDFEGINLAALAALPLLLARWLPAGRREGVEYLALNPTRADRRLGSFRVNLRSGKWADFACGAGGGDVVSLAAYLGDIGQREAAERLARMLGIEAHHGQ
jgi:hypothetical protein